MPMTRRNIHPFKLLMAGATATVLVLSFFVNIFIPQDASANAATRVQATMALGTGTTVSTTLSAVTAGNLIVVICTNKGTTTISVPTPGSLTTVLNQSGTPSMGIFYKIAVAGQNTYTCSFGTGNPNSIQAIEYRSFTTPITGVQANSSTGSSNVYATGSVTTTTATRIIIGAYVVNTNTNAPTWTNSFANIQDQTVGSGNPAGRHGAGSAELLTTTTGTYSSAGTGTGTEAWRGQIVSFQSEPRELVARFVDDSGVPVSSPSVPFSTATTTYSCQTTNANLGTSTQRLRVKNTTLNPSWSLSLAATSGGSATWNSGAATYAYNNAAGSGCTSGQLSVNPSVATIAPQSGCTSTGLTLGSSQAFSNPTVNTITLLSASGASNLSCFWDITGIALSQAIPAERRSGTYTLNLTATVVAQ